MANSRARLALTEDEARAYLRDAKTLILCTTGPDGLPDPVPMWFVVDEPSAGEPEPGTVLMTTYGKSQKVVNLRRDPRAVGLVEDGTVYNETDRPWVGLVEDGTVYNELRGLQLTGRLDVVDDDDEVLDVLVRVATKYSGAEDSPEVRDGLAGQASKRALLRLVPEKVVSWDHRKM